MGKKKRFFTHPPPKVQAMGQATDYGACGVDIVYLGHKLTNWGRFGFSIFDCLFSIFRLYYAGFCG
jgi:hypothetical protein